MKKYPKYLYRHDDGFRFTLQSNNKYTMDKSVMNPKYEYSFVVLINSGFVRSQKEVKIIQYLTRNDGHGDFYEN